jgi:hypothetical protein
VHTSLDPAAQRVRPATDSHDLVRRDTTAQQALHDTTAQVAGGSGDDDGHGAFLSRQGRRTTVQRRHGVDASGRPGRRA